MRDEIYNQAIIARAKATTRAGRLDAPDASVTLDNPLCGDRVTMDVRLDGGRIVDLAYRVRGCVLCEAAAATIGMRAVGGTGADLERAEAALRGLLASQTDTVFWPELAEFRPVRDYKSRHDCLLLPFETAREAIAAARRKEQG